MPSVVILHRCTTDIKDRSFRSKIVFKIRKALLMFPIKLHRLANFRKNRFKNVRESYLWKNRRNYYRFPVTHSGRP